MRIFTREIVHGNRVIEKGASLEEVVARYGYGPEIVSILEYYTEEIQPAEEQPSAPPAAPQKSKRRKKK